MSEDNPMNGDMLPLQAMAARPWTLPFPLPAGREWEDFSLRYLVKCGPSCFCVVFDNDMDGEQIFKCYEVSAPHNNLVAHSFEWNKANPHLMAAHLIFSSPVGRYGLLVQYGADFMSEGQEKRGVIVQDITDPLTFPRFSEKFSTQFIGEGGEVVCLPLNMSLHGVDYMEDPLCCCLDGNYVFIPRCQSDLGPSGACIYDAAADVFTEDSRIPPLIRYSPYTVVDNTLHVFPDGAGMTAHWTYSLTQGWMQRDNIPKNLERIAYEEGFGRLFVFACPFEPGSGFYLYDTISGDLARVSDRQILGIRYSFGQSVRLQHDTLLCIDKYPVLDVENDLLPATLVTLTESLFYPSEDMGWGRLLESDKDWRVTLGIDKG
ncbi:hypothetical protein KIPB_009694 [Kipferlia bialata]|uniref:Uncharacterized protein n=1 Tax=Kipferlia bialata TaxID=797122 RepID=A0A391NPC7_9EUKA|nr:hypothetical protein KIPB_009694 [Kipferlia bialata]|eukprot:g9694.t1